VPAANLVGMATAKGKRQRTCLSYYLIEQVEAVALNDAEQRHPIPIPAPWAYPAVTALGVVDGVNSSNWG